MFDWFLTVLWALVIACLFGLVVSAHFFFVEMGFGFMMMAIILHTYARPLDNDSEQD